MSNPEFLPASEVIPVFGDGYAQKLAELTNPEIAHRMQTEVFMAPLGHSEGQIMYSRPAVQTATNDRSVMYIPGFTEGIVAKAPFGASMADRGFDIVLPGQYRKQILKNTFGKKDATYSQAMNYSAVMEHAGLKPGEFDVVTHSYGSLILQEMIEIAFEEGEAPFAGSNVVLLAPAGSNEDEGLLTLGWRFARHMVHENGTSKDFPDPDNEMIKAGTENMLANVPRAIREALHLAKRRMNYKKLATSGIGRAIVLGYVEDALFSHRVMETTMKKAMDAGIAYATPYSLQLLEDGSNRGGEGASHNDEQFNPERVSSAVAQFLLQSN